MKGLKCRRPRALDLFGSRSPTPRLMAMMIPVYLKNYGPTNFSILRRRRCHTLFAIWLESPLILSARWSGAFIPQMLWVIDFSSSWRTGSTRLTRQKFILL